MKNVFIVSSTQTALLDRLLPITPPPIYTAVIGNGFGCVQHDEGGPLLTLTREAAEHVTSGRGEVVTLEEAWPAIRAALDHGAPRAWIHALKKQFAFTRLGDQPKFVFDCDAEGKFSLVTSDSPLPVYCAVSDDTDWIGNASWGPGLSLVPAQVVKNRVSGAKAVPWTSAWPLLRAQVLTHYTGQIEMLWVDDFVDALVARN